MGQGDAVTDSGAMELLAFVQSAKQGLLGFRAIGDFRNPVDEFIQHIISLTATQTKLDGRHGNEVADQKAF
jgi:hypothetical protein